MSEPSFSAVYTPDKTSAISDHQKTGRTPPSFLGATPRLVAILVYFPALFFVAVGVPLGTHDYGYDSDFHLRLLGGTTNALNRGELWPLWLPEANDGFGSPVFSFYGFIPYLAAALIAFPLRLGPAAALALAMALARIGSFVTCRAWLRGHAGADQATLGAAAFVTMPYILLENPLIRSDFSETVSVAIAPLLFLAADRARNPAELVAGCALGIAGLALTNLPQAVLLGGLLVVYITARAGLKMAFAAVAAIGLGIAVAGFVIVPALTLQDEISPTAWIDEPGYHVANNFLFSWDHLSTNKSELIHEACLHLSWLLALGALALMCRRGGWRACFRLGAPAAIAWTLFVALFGMTDVARPVWASLAFLRALQFPWRLLPGALLMAAGAFTLALRGGRADPARSRIALVLLMSGQLALPVAGAAISATGWPDVRNASWRIFGHPAAEFISLFLPHYVSSSARSDLQRFGVQPDPPEYVPALARQAGWHVSNEMPHHLTGGVASHNSLLPQGVTAEPQPDGGFVFRGHRDQALIARLPAFWFPGWIGKTGGDPSVKIEGDPTSGMLQVTLPPGDEPVEVSRTWLPANRFGAAISAAALLTVLGTYWLGRHFNRTTPERGRSRPARG